MKIRLVWPRRFIEGRDLKPTTFFWLECSPNEAEDVLRATEADSATVISYYDAIKEAREYVESHAGDLFDDPASPGVVGMLFSSDGRRLENVGQYFPNQPILDGINPFVLIDPLRVDTVYDLWEIGDYLCDENPRLSDRLEWSDIPERADLKKLAQLDIEKYYGRLPKTEDEGLKANDDRLAMAIFSFMESPTGPYVWPDGSNDIAPDLVYELGRQWEARGKLDWWNHEESYPFKHKILRADEMPLYEIYQRRARAEHNLARLMNGIEWHSQLSVALLKLFTVDEVCEMLLLAWTQSHAGLSTYWNDLKPLLFTLSERIKPETEDVSAWYRDDLEGLFWPHAHESYDNGEEPRSVWPSIIQNAEMIAKKAHENQKDKAGAPYISHPARVVENVRAYEHFIWQSNPQRLLDQGGKHVANIIDGAIAAAWLHDVIEDSGDYGVQITAQHLLANDIPSQVVDAVELLTDIAQVEETIKDEIQRDATKTQLKLDYYKKISENEIARIVKLADLADNCNLQRIDLMRLKGGHVDPNKYPVALAALQLTPEEWEWFNETIKKQVI